MEILVDEFGDGSCVCFPMELSRSECDPFHVLSAQASGSIDIHRLSLRWGVQRMSGQIQEIVPDLQTVCDVLYDHVFVPAMHGSRIPMAPLRMNGDESLTC